MPAVILKNRPSQASARTQCQHQERREQPAMEARTVNPFIIAAVQIIRQNTGLSVAKDNVFVQKGKFSPAGTGMSLDISGQIHGKIVYEFSKGVAARLSQRMVEKQLDLRMLNAGDFRKLLHAALLELGNQITARAITLLEESGINCSISPPSFFIGQDLQLIHPHLKTIVLSLKTEYGPFSINIALYA